jgi:hypothetical protein
MAKIDRKFLAHYINVNPGATADYVRIGSDLEEYNAELSAQVDSTKNILGETSIKISSYTKTGGVTPFYADTGNSLYEFLQDIADNSLTLDDVATDIVEVHLWETPTAGAYPAIKEKCFIEVVSYGGDTTGYQIPFNVHYTGEKTTGTFDPSAKTFT